MNILFISENYFPKISGVPVVVRYLAEGLLKKGHNVTIVTRRHEGLEPKTNINGVDVYRFYLNQDRFYRPSGEITEYLNFIKFFGADVIIVECAECVTTNVVLPVLESLKSKKIFHSHGFSGLTLKPFKRMDSLKHTIGNTFRWITVHLYYATFFKKYIGYFDTTLCLSEVDSSKEYLSKFSKGVLVLDNAVDNEFLKPAEKSMINLPKDYFLSVANYLSVKNQKGILREFYKSDIKDYAMVFVGRETNEYYKELKVYNELLEEKYGHRDVYFLYGIDRQQIPYIVQHASLYLVASSFEEYSISIIEAMSKGVPFISTNVGNASILPGGVTVNSEYEISNTIRWLINSPEESRKLSERGKAFVQENCIKDKVIDKLDNIIQTL